VWDRLLGCFGDALLRKFGASPPQEWTGAIAHLQDPQIERGMRRLLFGWKGGPPSLPDFMRLCRTIGTDEFDEADSGLPKLAHDDSFAGDAWDMVANRYLMGHIATLMKKNPKCFGRPASVKLMQAPLKDLQDLGIDPHYLDASGELVENVKRLIAAKNAWAVDMRDIAVNGAVPPENQKTIWRDYMQRAGWPA
jgi:hypothetical protein